jgi:hypothetical protein
LARKIILSLFEKGVEWAQNNGMKPIIFDYSGHMSFIEEKEKCIEAILNILAQA